MLLWDMQAQITKNSDIIESYWSIGKSMSEDRNELTAVVLW